MACTFALIGFYFHEVGTTSYYALHCLVEQIIFLTYHSLHNV